LSCTSKSISLWLFWRWGLVNYFLGLASNHGTPYLSFPSNWDYRCEPPPPALLSVHLSDAHLPGHGYGLTY
jgi:hypothetical protein